MWPCFGFNVFACQKYEAKVALGYLRKNNMGC